MTKLLIRFFDLVLSTVGLVVFIPFFLVLSLLIILDSKGGVFFFQQRVGKGGRDFTLWKFRTMRPGAEGLGQITVGAHEARITGIGKFLRRYKIDELPQLVNVIKGDMSLVGPRPEVRKYVDLYTKDQQKVLSVKPGITDFASIEYADENEMLLRSADPLKTYVEEIMPTKITLNLKYIEDPSLANYFRIIALTIRKIF